MPGRRWLMPAVLAGTVIWPAGALDLSLDQLKATRERPLFVPGRRAAPPPAVFVPPAEVAAEPAVQAVPPPSVTLTGVIIGAGTRMAILREAGGGRTSSVKVGDHVEGWTVQAVEPRLVRLEHDGQTTELPLKSRDGAVEAGDQPVPPQVPPMVPVSPPPTGRPRLGPPTMPLSR